MFVQSEINVIGQAFDHEFTIQHIVIQQQEHLIYFTLIIFKISYHMIQFSNNDNECI